MLTVKMELYDENEVEAYHKLVSVIRKYREQLAEEESARWARPVTPAAAEEVVDAPEHPAPEPVVASITPEGAVKTVEIDKVQAAAQKYAEVHGIEKAFEVVKRFGASRITEIKDPVKLALLYAELTK